MANLAELRNIARNDLARAFLFRRGVLRCNEEGEFVSCLSVDALTQDRGDVTTIECPSPTRYGEFVEIGTIPGELSRMTTTITGRMSRTEISTFYKLFIENCAFDLHLHFGLCQAPDDFARYDKALVFENVQVTSFSTEPLIALQSADRAAINESIDISIGRFYEVVNLAYGLRGQAAFVADDGVIVDIAICDNRSCGGDCEDSSSGCDKIFALSDTFKVYVSSDGGVTWTRDEILAGPYTTSAIAIACFRNQVVVLASDGDLWYTDRASLVANTATWSTTAFAGTPQLFTDMDTNSSFGIVIGAVGTVFMFVTPETGLVLVDNGFATAEDLFAVDVTDEVAVAVGDAGAVIYSIDGEIWFAATVIDVLGNNRAIAIKSRNNWLVSSTLTANLYCSDNSGRTWNLVSYPKTADEITKFAVATNHVVYMQSVAFLFRSIDGGATWVREPNTSQTFPTVTGKTGLAACSEDPNFVVSGGESAVAGIPYLAVGVPV